MPSRSLIVVGAAKSNVNIKNAQVKEGDNMQGKFTKSRGQPRYTT